MNMKIPWFNHVINLLSNNAGVKRFTTGTKKSHVLGASFMTVTWLLWEKGLLI